MSMGSVRRSRGIGDAELRM